MTSREEDVQSYISASFRAQSLYFRNSYKIFWKIFYTLMFGAKVEMVYFCRIFQIQTTLRSLINFFRDSFYSVLKEQSLLFMKSYKKLTYDFLSRSYRVLSCESDTIEVIRIKFPVWYEKNFLLSCHFPIHLRWHMFSEISAIRRKSFTCRARS